MRCLMLARIQQQAHRRWCTVSPYCSQFVTERGGQGLKRRGGEEKAGPAERALASAAPTRSHRE